MNLCLYADDGGLLKDYEVDLGGELCGRRPCWLPKSTKGFGLKDKDGQSKGLNKVTLLSGDPGKGKILIQGKNNSKRGLVNLPPLAYLLANETTPTVQVISQSGL